ncbi:SNF2 family N-terminal domain-containing protein [Stachybotrys elegans]|uniref:SNF2 family N-terminal domain-containing protein n=1 Tax=Stachybotrys elegans TaxID=80388 RepID=A0A8K0T200_9HYPO|nr:SNF2 family N-terminal domain-containing protein [Stachybotrys elegans]
MPPDTSPLPIRYASHHPRSSPSVRRFTIDPSEMDELATDTIPCSPLAIPRDTTQATQLLDRPGLAMLRSSSPASIIEVPASSPFQPPKPKPLGTRIAPAGTVFRPPPRQQPAPSKKRPAPEPISLLSDDEDDYLQSRGDIRPTDFKSHISSFAYDPKTEENRIDEKQIKTKMRQIYDVLGDTYTSVQVRDALKACKNDLDDALVYLESGKATPAPPPVSTKPKGRRLISKAAMQTAPKPDNKSFSSSVTLTSPSPQKKPPRRRLVQGLRQRQSSPPQSFSQETEEPEEPEVIELPSSEDPLVIDLVDNDKDDAYRGEASPEPVEDDDRVLTCINESTLKELSAMTGMKENLLEALIEKRPFDDLDAARRVTISKKGGVRKSSKISVGDNVVDAVEVFLNAVSAIDEVVAKCDAKGLIVKGIMDTWDLDVFGQSRQSRTSPENELPPTPTSLSGSKCVRPPIPRQPKYMDGHCTMKPFQLFGLNWMSLLYNYDIGCILADEMGLGKTCQVISLMCHLVEDYEKKGTGERPWPNLVVVPPSTYNNWLGEFERFAPDLSVVGYRGSQNERAEIAYTVEQNPEDYHVVLATYSQINSEADIEAMRSFGLNTAVFDEGHKMKNPETKIYKDLRRIPANWKMLLTGTPVQNNLLEMTSLLSFINPKMFEGYMEHIQYIFSQKVTIRDVSNGAFLYTERVRRARTILGPFILQRRKDQVVADMPQKICNVVHCDMDETQRAVYDEYEELFKTEPSQRSGRAKGRGNDLNNVWMQLRKAALHPLLFRRHFNDEKVEKMAKILMDKVPQYELHQPDIKHLIQELKNASDFELHLWCRDYPRLLERFDIPDRAVYGSAKVKKLLELIGQYKKNGDRVLVFSKFSRVIELLQEVLSQEGINYRMLMGNTDVSARQTLIDEYNQDTSIPVFLLTTGAGGTGINLTSANKVIIFDQSDNPQDDIQAENRAHRLGQTRDVEIIRLISTQTIEELIYKACQKKIELANKVTGAIEEEENAEQNLEKEVRKMMANNMTPP